MILLSGSGGVSSRGKPHKTVVHKATLTAARVPSPPPIPAKYRGKASKPVRLPSIGKLGKGSGGGIMTPVPAAGGKRSPRVSIPHPTGPISPYANPFAGSGPVTGGRIDQGVDYTGRPGAPIGAIGPGKITFASNQTGWPGGGFIIEKLSAGPSKGKFIYTAEDVQPTVKPGQQVKAGQQIGKFNQGGWIEAGFGGSATQDFTLANAIGQSGGSVPTGAGAFSTGFGVAFSNLVAKLGGPRGVVAATVHGSAPASFSSTGGKVRGVRASVPVIPAIPVVSGVNPPASGGVPAPPMQLAANRTPTGPPARLPKVKRTPTGPPVSIISGASSAGGGTTTTASGGTVTNITVPPDFIYSSGQTGGITYGTNVAQPVATGTTGAKAGPGLGTLLLAGGGLLVVLLLVARHKK